MIFISYLFYYILIYLNNLHFINSIYSVAFECGKPALYLENNKWMVDLNSDCLTDEQNITTYCQNIYGNQNLTKVIQISTTIKASVSNWCQLNTICAKNIEKQFQIKPFICLGKIIYSILYDHN